MIIFNLRKENKKCYEYLLCFLFFFFCLKFFHCELYYNKRNIMVCCMFFSGLNIPVGTITEVKNNRLSFSLTVLSFVKVLNLNTSNSSGPSCSKLTTSLVNDFVKIYIQ